MIKKVGIRKVFIDGQELHEVRSVQLDITAGQVQTVTLVFCADMKVDAEGSIHIVTGFEQ